MTITTTTTATRVTAMNQTIAERQGDLGIEKRGLFVRRPILGGVEILTRRLRRELERNTHEDDTVHFCLRGELGHALVCLDDRLLILKRGFHAGTTFGAMAATIFYSDITGILVRMQAFSGSIEISSPGFNGSESRRNRFRGSQAGSYRQPNCVPIQRRHLARYHVALAELRRLVAEVKLEPDRFGVVDQLERLSSLRRQGALDDAEFAAAKGRLFEAATVETRESA
jgi:hypothetical protein